MGRGRQKAKHTKVARELKYFSPDTNYGALQKELATGDPVYDAARWADVAESTPADPYEDEYAEYEDVYGTDDDEDDEDEDGAAQRTA